MLLKKIKSDSLEARKARNTNSATLLTTLYSEASMVGKNKGNRESTNEEVIQVIEKFVKNAIEVRDILTKNGKNPDKVNAEINLLNKYLPKKFTESELREIISVIIGDLKERSPKMLGQVMKALKVLYEGKYDGKMASNITKELLEG